MDEPSRTPSEAGGAQDVEELMNRIVPLSNPETSNAEDESDGNNEAVDKETGKLLAAFNPRGSDLRRQLTSKSF